MEELQELIVDAVANGEFGAVASLSLQLKDEEAKAHKAARAVKAANVNLRCAGLPAGLPLGDLCDIFNQYGSCCRVGVPLRSGAVRGGGQLVRG